MSVIFSNNRTHALVIIVINVMKYAHRPASPCQPVWRNTETELCQMREQVRVSANIFNNECVERFRPLIFNACITNECVVKDLREWEKGWVLFKTKEYHSSILDTVVMVKLFAIHCNSLHQIMQKYYLHFIYRAVIYTQYMSPILCILGYFLWKTYNICV